MWRKEGRGGGREERREGGGVVARRAGRRDGCKGGAGTWCVSPVDRERERDRETVLVSRLVERPPVSPHPYSTPPPPFQRRKNPTATAGATTATTGTILVVDAVCMTPPLHVETEGGRWREDGHRTEG